MLISKRTRMNTSPNAGAPTGAVVPAWLDRQAYPFVSRWLDVGAGRMHYVDEGEGPVVLFVHGTPTWSFEYRHLIEGLRATHRCVAVDHLGFGLSDRPADAAYTPEAHAERLRAFVEKLGLARFTLVVHDFGGPIALPLALDGSGRVERLVVLNSWMWSFADDAEMMRRARLVTNGFGKFLYRRLNASLRLVAPSAYGDRKKLTKAIHHQYLPVFGDADSRERVLFELARALTGSSAHYDALWQQRAELAKLPVLIVWGLKDSAFRPHLLAKWRQAVPHAEVVVLSYAGHWPHEEEPQAVLSSVRAFLAERH
jgi:haloalkane dehalogenase